MQALCWVAIVAMAYETNFCFASVAAAVAIYFSSTESVHDIITTHHRALSTPSAHTLFRIPYAFSRVVWVCVCGAVNEKATQKKMEKIMVYGCGLVEF